MKTFMATIAGAAVLTGFGASGFGGPLAGSGANGAALVAQARHVAVEFFRSQNERRYDDLCALFSRGFIRAHALRDRRTCAAVNRAEFVWSLRIEFRIGRVVREGDRLVVQAVADGAPGRIVLVREDGGLKILAVEGA
jgi:hypothetical protein